MKGLLHSLLVASVVAIALPAQAQFAKPEDALKYRQSVMFLQSQHAGRINAQLKADKPNFQIILDNVAILDTVNKLFFDAFPANSEMLANTRAKSEVWTNPSKFKQGAETLNTNVERLSAAARSNDLAATRAAFGEVGKTCKGCHDEFRRD
jgi:cytochrome c556